MVQRRVKINGGTHIFVVFWEKLVRSSKQIQGRYAEVQLFCRQELKGKVGFGTAKGQNQWRYAHLFRVLGKTVCFAKQIEILQLTVFMQKCIDTVQIKCMINITTVSSRCWRHCINTLCCKARLTGTVQQKPDTLTASNATPNLRPPMHHAYRSDLGQGAAYK